MPSIFNAKLNFEQWLNVPLGTPSAAGAAGEDQPHAITVTEEEKLLIIDRLHKASISMRFLMFLPTNMCIYIYILYINI